MTNRRHLQNKRRRFVTATQSSRAAQAAKALALFAKTPLVRARDLNEAGGARETLRRVVASGELEQPARGVYVRPGAVLSREACLK